jgi:hypothetical protein
VAEDGRNFFLNLNDQFGLAQLLVEPFIVPL